MRRWKKILTLTHRRTIDDVLAIEYVRLSSITRQANPPLVKFDEEHPRRLDMRPLPLHRWSSRSTAYLQVELS